MVLTSPLTIGSTMRDLANMAYANMSPEQKERWKGYCAEVSAGTRPQMTMAFMLDVQCDKDIAPKVKVNQYDDNDNIVVEDMVEDKYDETTALVDIDDPRGNELHGLIETVPVEPDEHDLLQSTVMKYMGIIASNPRVYLFQQKSRYSGLEITIKIPNLKD